MKWIGQHIWDFISRFRNDVYLESTLNPGTDTDKFLVTDSEGLVGYRTGAEVAADIGAAAYDDTAIQAEVDLNTAKVDLTIDGAGTVHANNYTDTDTVYDATTIQAEVDLNTAKVSNIVGDLTITAAGHKLQLNTSNGNNVSLPLATTDAWGVMSDEMFDDHITNNAKVSNVTQTTITGNAGTATVLATARAINGINFDGSASITIPTYASSTQVKILPRDFIADDGGRPLAIDDSGAYRFLESHSANPMFASVLIPEGFKATHVHIYGTGSPAITVYEADVNSRVVTSKGTGNVGTNLNITDVTSDATNYILIELVQASGDQVNGGIMTIAVI